MVVWEEAVVVVVVVRRSEAAAGQRKEARSKDRLDTICGEWVTGGEV
jgi:hypothetical protein